jgi:hypothetical protein
MLRLWCMAMKLDYLSNEIEFVDPWKDDLEHDISQARDAYVRFDHESVAHNGNSVARGNSAIGRSNRVRSRVIDTSARSIEHGFGFSVSALRLVVSRTILDKRTAWLIVCVLSSVYAVRELNSGHFNSAAIVLSVVALFGFAAEHFSEGK